MHEDRRRLCIRHDLSVNLIRRKQADALAPDFRRLAHGDPDVGINDVGVFATFLHAFGQRNGAARFRGDSAACFHQVGGGHLLFRAARHEMQAQLRTDHHQGVCHIVLGIAHEHQLLALDTFGKFLGQREHVGNHLRGMEFRGQTVPNYHARLFGELFHDILAVTAILNAVEHAAEHARSVFNGFHFAHLRACRIKIRHAHAQVVTGNLKRAARTRRGFLEQQDNILAFKITMRLPRLFLCFELGRQVDKIANFIWREIQKLQEIASTQIDFHNESSFLSMLRAGTA